MDISNEMIAAYAEGSLPEEYLPLVRKYLSEHPDELEDVLLLMDSSLPSSELIDGTGISKVSSNNIIMLPRTHPAQDEGCVLAKEMSGSYRKKNEILSNITKLLKEIM